ncbi:MAG TPA: hypothetical protein VF980_03630 [Thermoanaerobaculia bacterium]
MKGRVLGPRSSVLGWLAALAMVGACHQHVDRTRWLQMSSSEKTVYVRSLLGGEKAKAAKGGAGPTYSGRAEEYVARIDEAYAHGDGRDPAAIFAGMADRR